MQNKQNHWPLSEGLLSQIPVYGPKIANAKTLTPETERLVIFDPVERDKSQMMDLVEYLHTGRVKFMKTTGGYDERTRARSFDRLIALCGLAKSLHMDDLEREVCSLISQQTDVSAGLFTKVALRCCAADSMVDVSEGSAVGTWIRTYLAAHAKELEQGGHTEKIIDRGGRLVTILVKVLLERQASDLESGACGSRTGCASDMSMVELKACKDPSGKKKKDSGWLARL